MCTNNPPVQSKRLHAAGSRKQVLDLKMLIFCVVHVRINESFLVYDIIVIIYGAIYIILYQKRYYHALYIYISLHTIYGTPYIYMLVFS